MWRGDERTMANIFSTARGAVSAWSDPTVAEASDGCDITPEWLLNGDNTLYLVAPAKRQERLQPVFAGLVADLVHAAFDRAMKNKGSLDRRLLVMLDEAANICPIRELPSWCSTCPSHGITLMTIWQDRSQQHSRYGRDNAETIWNNSGARVVLSGIADKATGELSRMLGEEEYERTSLSVDGGSSIGGGRRSVSTQTSTRRIVSEDSLRRQDTGQGLLIYKNLPPMRLQLRPWHTTPALQELQAAKASK